MGSRFFRKVKILDADSGSPIIQVRDGQNVLVGLAQSGYFNFEYNLPSVAVDIYQVKDWITGIVSGTRDYEYFIVKYYVNHNYQFIFFDTPLSQNFLNPKFNYQEFETIEYESQKTGFQKSSYFFGGNYAHLLYVFVLKSELWNNYIGTWIVKNTFSPNLKMQILNNLVFDGLKLNLPKMKNLIQFQQAGRWSEWITLFHSIFLSPNKDYQVFLFNSLLNKLLEMPKSGITDNEFRANIQESYNPVQVDLGGVNFFLHHSSKNYNEFVNALFASKDLEIWKYVHPVNKYDKNWFLPFNNVKKIQSTIFQNSNGQLSYFYVSSFDKNDSKIYYPTFDSSSNR